MHKNTLIKNEQGGAAIILAMVILAVLTILGTVSTKTSRIELAIAANDQISKTAYYAAEAGRLYSQGRSELFHGDNVAVGSGLTFPDPEDTAAAYDLGAGYTFDGSVEYLGDATVPRGSGNDVGSFRAHRYRILSRGHGPRNAETHIEAAFYRIGF